MKKNQVVIGFAGLNEDQMNKLHAVLCKFAEEVQIDVKKISEAFNAFSRQVSSDEKIKKAIRGLEKVKFQEDLPKAENEFIKRKMKRGPQWRNR